MNPYIRTRPGGRSWHIVRTWTRMPNVAVTLCGRRASGETGASFGDDKSCESCLRMARFQAVAEAEGDRLTL